MLLSTASVQADDAIGRYYYSGMIGKKTAIQMEAQVKGERVSGHYYYNRYGIPLSIQGSRDDIEERDPKNLYTGKFEGKAALPHKSFEGRWSTPDGSRQLPFRLEKVAEYVFSNTQQGETLEVSLSYPYFLSASPAWQQINAALHKSISQVSLEFITEARTFLGEADQPFYRSLFWHQQTAYSIEYYSETLLSLLGKYYQYTGGAHGNTHYQSKNFWIREDEVILLKLSDLFLQGYQKRLSQECIRSLREQGAGDVVNGSITELAEKDLRQFSLTPRGLTVYFAPYAVGAYAEGTFLVTIPYLKLKPVIDTGGPLKVFIE